MAHHFDLAVIGSHTAARIAALLSARQGLRVLVVPGTSAEPASCLLPSLLWNELLKLLGRQSGEAHAPRFQIITDNCRLDLNGPCPLNEELRRELPRSHESVLRFLNDLQARGLKLERGLLQCPDAPLYGWRSKFVGLWRPGVRFNTFLNKKIQDSEAQLVLQTLFSALSLSPSEDLGVDEAALLWSNLHHPCSLSSAEFDQILTQALSRSTAQLLAPMKNAGGRISGQGPYTLELPKGPSMSADVLVIGDPQLLSSSPWPPKPSQGSVVTTGLLSFQLPEQSVSPLLAPRIALADTTTLRVLLDRREQNVSLQAAWVEPDNLPNDWVQGALRRLLPFVAAECLRAPVSTLAQTININDLFPRPGSKAQNGKDFLMCNAALLYPRLGFFGEILCGFAAAHHLARRFGKKVKAI